MFILHSDQFKPKSYLKLIKNAYLFSEGEQFPLRKYIDTRPLNEGPKMKNAHAADR